MQSGGGSRLTEGTVALLPEGKQSPAVLLTVLLLTLLVSDAAQEHGDAISTDITSCRNPTLLQQLASFAALREVAEEEQLDWGAQLVFGRQKRRGLYVQPAKTESEEETNDESARVSDGGTTNSATAASGSSRRRPHRRLRRQKSAMQQSCDNNNNNNNKDVVCGDDGTRDDDGMGSHKRTNDGSNSAGCGVSSAGSVDCVRTPRGSLASAAASASAAVSPTLRLWSQLHVVGMALSTHDNNFLHITERFAHYEGMYPIVYHCDIGRVIAPHEEELLSQPTTGLQKSRFWSCRSCGRAHDVVRETCVRCRRHSGPYTKLFFGQTVKERDAAKSVLRLLYATHPGVTVHRIEAHQREDGRVRGCASVYVSVDAASELISKLNGNVFFDTHRTFPSSLDKNCDVGVEGLHVHYVYTSQRPWLEALIAVRASQRPYVKTMPWGALVVEDSRESAHATRGPTAITGARGCGRRIPTTTGHTSHPSHTVLRISVNEK